MARQKNSKKKVAVGRPKAWQVTSPTSVKSDVLRESLADAMKPLLTFAEVLKQTESPHVLLGNGFSMAYDRKRFSFTTLLESATKEGIIDAKSELYKVFQKLATADFETVMRAMENSKNIIAVYGGDTTLQNKIASDSDALKEYLVKIITNNHPEKSTSLPEKEKTACVSFLKNFKRIYTLNYDLLLYWASMQDPSASFTDGFGNNEDSVHKGYVVYKNSGASQHSMNVHYLHGALHYFDAGDEIIKKTYANTDVNLIDQVRDSLKHNIYPIFISEGTSEQKKTKILHSAYLNHCYKSLRQIGGELVIFGASLKENDRHILEAILDSNVKKIYLGVSDEASGNALRFAVEERNKKSDTKHQKELHLYDYKTVNVSGR
jgi:hypothetical protein